MRSPLTHPSPRGPSPISCQIQYFIPSSLTTLIIFFFTYIQFLYGPSLLLDPKIPGSGTWVPFSPVPALQGSPRAPALRNACQMNEGLLTGREGALSDFILLVSLQSLLFTGRFLFSSLLVLIFSGIMIYLYFSPGKFHHLFFHFLSEINFPFSA